LIRNDSLTAWPARRLVCAHHHVAAKRILGFRFRTPVKAESHATAPPAFELTPYFVHDVCGMSGQPLRRALLGGDGASHWHRKWLILHFLDAIRSIRQAKHHRQPNHIDLENSVANLDTS